MYSLYNGGYSAFLYKKMYSVLHRALLYTRSAMTRCIDMHTNAVYSVSAPASRRIAKAVCVPHQLQHRRRAARPLQRAEYSVRSAFCLQ